MKLIGGPKEGISHIERIKQWQNNLSKGGKVAKRKRKRVGPRELTDMAWKIAIYVP